MTKEEQIEILAIEYARARFGASISITDAELKTAGEYAYGYKEGLVWAEMIIDKLES